MRRWLPRRGWQFYAAAARTLVGIARPSASFEGSIGEFASLLVPGLHQMRHGEKHRGRIMLGVFLVLLLLALVFAGTGTGSLVLGLLFGWHVISAVDAMCRDFAAPGDRYRFAAIVSLAMFTLVYLPVLWMVQQIATPMSIAMPTRYFKTGDVVWVRPVASPDAGDLALRMSRRRLRTFAIGECTIRVTRSPGCASIVWSRPRGQTVRFDKGQLMVDGRLSPWQPQRERPRGVGNGDPARLITSSFCLRICCRMKM